MDMYIRKNLSDYFKLEYKKKENENETLRGY